MRQASPSVSSYLGRPDSHVTEAEAHTDTHTSRLNVPSYWKKQPDGGMCHTLSVSLIEGLAAARRGSLGC